MAWFTSREPGRNNRRQQGFTIIELMIVLLILGILVGIVVMTMTVSRSKAQQAACKANLKTIEDAVHVYMSAHGQFPPDLDALVNQPDPKDNYIKSSFKWMCPSGDYGSQSGDYRTYYNSTTGQTSCPRPNHNP